MKRVKQLPTDGTSPSHEPSDSYVDSAPESTAEEERENFDEAPSDVSTDDEMWDVFLADDDECDPERDPGDFWFEDD